MKKEKRITIRLNEEEYKRIEEIAQKLNTPISRLMRNLTLAGLEDPELFEKLGFFEIAKMIEKLREKPFGLKDFSKVQNEHMHEERPSGRTAGRG